MNAEMMIAAEERWQAWHEGRKVAMLGLAVVGLFALVMGAWL